MDRPDTTATPVRTRTAEEARPTAELTQQRCQPTLTWRQRLLAGATATAILLSGLNALVQVWKVVVESGITEPAKTR